MTPSDVAAALGPGVGVQASYGEIVADVPTTRWAEEMCAARDRLGLAFFDFLTAVDLLEAGFEVVARLWSVEGRVGLQLRARCSRERPEVPSAAGVFAGAAWHERAVAELFGITFLGHPAPAPLLLSGTTAGHPLRKDFVLAARVAKPWPGANEPGESAVEAGSRTRRKHRPLGVPPDVAGLSP